VSVKNRTVAGLAGLALAGGACMVATAGAPAAHAASVKCGTACSSLFNQKFGSTDVSAVSGSTATGSAVILAGAAPSAAQDWAVIPDGIVSSFFKAGLINATMNKHYASDELYEYEYVPARTFTTLCLGVAAVPGNGTKVVLEQCGVSASTLWIDDAAAAADSAVSTVSTALSGEYAPLISGSDTQYPAPEVLTATAVGGDFTTTPLSVNAKGVVAPNQMWQTISGVLH
jgi:hypothetical protein